MKYHIVIAHEASLNIGKASDYYEAISVSLRDRFERELIETTDRLKANPLHYQIRYRGIRIAFIKTFLFGVHFIIEGETIYVLQVLHTRSYYR